MTRFDKPRSSWTYYLNSNGPPSVWLLTRVCGSKIRFFFCNIFVLLSLLQIVFYVSITFAYCLLRDSCSRLFLILYSLILYSLILYSLIEIETRVVSQCRSLLEMLKNLVHSEAYLEDVRKVHQVIDSIASLIAGLDVDLAQFKGIENEADFIYLLYLIVFFYLFHFYCTLFLFYFIYLFILYTLSFIYVVFFFPLSFNFPRSQSFQSHV
jgi:hypothetical protein